MEGLPTEPFNSTVGKLGAAFDEEVWLFDETNTDSPFGALRTIVDEAKAGHLDRPSETIATGNDLSAKWERIVKAAQDVDGNFEYRPISQNSNTFVFHALKEAGLQPATGLSDSGERFNSPGADKDFENPIPSIEFKTIRANVQTFDEATKPPSVDLNAGGARGRCSGMRS